MGASLSLRAHSINFLKNTMHTGRMPTHLTKLYAKPLLKMSKEPDLCGSRGPILLLSTAATILAAARYRRSRHLGNQSWRRNREATSGLNGLRAPQIAQGAIRLPGIFSCGGGLWSRPASPTDAGTRGFWSRSTHKTCGTQLAARRYVSSLYADGGGADQSNAYELSRGLAQGGVLPTLL